MNNDLDQWLASDRPSECCILSCDDIDAALTQVEYRAQAMPNRRVASWSWPDLPEPPRIRQELLLALGEAVRGLWPQWYREPRLVNLTAGIGVDRAALRALLDEMPPHISRVWAEEAFWRAKTGETLLFGQTTPSEQARQLCACLDPRGSMLILALETDPGEHLRAWREALGWLAEAGGARVAGLVPEAPPQRDRSSRAPRRWVSRLEGQPHPFSKAEQKLAKALAGHADLAGLFGHNQRIGAYLVDLLWPAGRLVVEIDGPEHRQAAKYEADRQRDFELLRDGYRVLRLTNAEVLRNTSQAIDKIDQIVRLSRREQ